MFWQHVHQLDQQITLTINSWNSAFTDPIWAFLSMKLVWVPLYAAILALIIWKLGWKKGLVVLAAAGLTFGLCDQFSNIIKDAVGRVRPLNDPFMLENGLNILEKSTRSFSFFSAHAANAFGIATCTCVAFTKIITPINEAKPKWLRIYTAWMFTWAALVAISRVFVGKHYLGDVLAGALIGAAAGYAFAWIASRICTRF